MKVTRILAAAAVASIAAGTLAATASAYTGAISFQNSIYSFRNGMADTTYADYWADSVVVWPQGGALDQTYPDFADYFDWDIEAYIVPGGFTNVTFDGDGTYTVSSDEFAWEIDGVDAFNFIQVSTDVPYAPFDKDAGATAFVTSATVYVDGVAQATIENPPVEPDTNKNLVINCANIWNSDAPAYTGAYPTESLAVEFTIEGLGGAADAGDASDAVVDTEAPATDAGKDSPDTGVEGVAAVAGLAVIAGGALLLSKKRK